MSRSLRSLAGVLVLVSASLLSGCGGGSAKPAPGMGCALNSDCATGLTCTFGLCHSACVINGDCPAGQLCVESDTVGDGGKINVCQLPAELKCVYNSNCTSPLICARDQQCRNQCQMDVDCVSPQVCTNSKVCALTSQLAPGTNDVPVVTTGVGGAAGGNATGTGGAAGGAATGTGGSATGTGGVGGGSAGATGTGGAAGAKGTGGTAGSCATACALGFQCVSGTCQACGTSGASCCGTGASATCNSNLTCVSGTCTCGDSGQACCTGTTCNTGFQCTTPTGGTPVCSCGGAGQYCCAGTPQCTGSLSCGGRRCGCAKSCDQNAAVKNDGSIFISGTPVTNTNGTLFLAASVSDNPFFACALKADGTVWCWGSNTYGALGIGDTTIASSTKPLQVSTAMASGSPLTGITSVVVADYGYTACAIGANGTLWCWGYGGYGQLGIGDESNSSIAVPVVVDAGATPVTGFKSVSPSYYNTCGLKTDNTAWCWGDNYYGAIGNGSPAMVTARYFPYPTQVTNLATSATSIMASYWNYNACASTADGSAYCWGNNTSGNLSNGLATGYSNVPSQVQTASGIPLTMVAKVLNWYGKTCAVRTDGSIWCWPESGTNYYAYQLKDSASNRITGLSIIGRDCYLDSDDQVWVNGSTSTSYQVTCP